MVVLELKAALKAFKPASVTFVSPVWVCQQSIRDPTRSNNTWTDSYEHDKHSYRVSLLW